MRQQDQTNSSLLSLGGGPAPREQLHARRRLDRRPAQPRGHHPLHRGGGGSEGPGQHLRRRDGPHRRRRLQHHRQVGRQRLARQRARPEPAQRRRAAFFFARQGSACEKPDTYFYLYGGSLGGPIVRNKTFFWARREGYKTNTVRNAVVRLPTERELNGDFSQSGVTIYDPLTTTRSTGQLRSPSPAT